MAFLRREPMKDIEFEFQDPCIKDLEDCLYKGPIIIIEGEERRRFDEALIDRIKNLRVVIKAHEHPPAHFHVEFNEESNSFRIDNGDPIHSKGLNEYYRNIRKWYKKNRAKLVDAWNNSRPDDCPVGKVK
jgi:hypothetical protein